MTARALILAAGRGERMRPLSDTTPKPLLAVRGKPLIEWHLEALARAGVREVVVNTAWLEERFEPALGDGSRWGLAIRWQRERERFGAALETGGGIATALPWLAPRGDEAFWIVSGDVFVPGFAFDDAARRRFEGGADLGRIWLVPNPPYHPGGDFALDGDRARRDGVRPFTYANVALAKPALVAGLRPGLRAPLAPALFAAAAEGRLGGERWPGEWHNVGTPADLAAVG